ncbi:MAG: hypothetical protein ACRYGP_01285 [Janthinobacterium lividum]
MNDDPNLVYRTLDTSTVLRHRATMVVTPQGGAIRTLIKGAARHPTGRYVSAKAGRAQPWKSLDELARIIVCEVDPSVRTYQVQPHRIDFHLPRRVVHFFADLRIDRWDGAVDIELSPAGKDVSKGEVIDWARVVYDALGWRLRLRTAEDRSRSSVIEANCKLIEGDRFAVVPPSALLLARRIVEGAGGQVPYGELIAAIGESVGGKPRGRAVVHAMIVHGQLDLDLATPIRPRTPVRLKRSRVETSP